MLVASLHRRRGYHPFPNHPLEAQSSSKRTGSSEGGDDITPVSQGQGARGADRSEIMDPAPSTVVSRPLAVQESLKRKVPHDGFEEQDTVCCPILLIVRIDFEPVICRMLDTHMFVMSLILFR